MLLQPSHSDRLANAELPLDTPEQIEHARAVDDALERRAQRRQEENKAEAGEIANREARFSLLRTKILLAVGLLLLVLLVAAAAGLWCEHQQIGALWLLGSGTGASGAGVWLRESRKA